MEAAGDKVILETNLPGFPLKRGKVRDIYDLGENLLILATDRISAFDSVLGSGIPHKGLILTALSRFWFDFTAQIAENHCLTCDLDEMPEGLKPYREILKGRSMLVKKAVPLPVECVVRGYLAGSAFREYKDVGCICGVRLPQGLVEASRLPEPLFTPATKARTGHDENITFEQMLELVGEKRADFLQEKSLAIYEKAADYARTRGIIIADTKFEWGQVDDTIILIDEVLTPDSSRFWPLNEYEPGRPQASFDKQFVRDYLEASGWNKEPPAPALPEEIVQKTSEKYIEAYERLTGKKFDSSAI
jgi:phosphoribosylaminoimidazole-succinocarboxamide synthase